MLRCSLRALSIALAGTLLAASAQAQETSVDIQIDHEAAQDLGLDPQQVETELGDALDQAVAPFDQGPLLGAMAEAAGIAGKGMGVDYASNPETFVLGASFGPGANATGFVTQRPESRIPAYGFALQGTAMAGINLGVIEDVIEGREPDEEPGFLDRFVVSVNGGYLQFADRTFRASMHNAGLHGTFHAVLPERAGALEWGGLSLTAGWERSAYVLTLTEDLPLSRSMGDDATVAWNATGSYEMRVFDDSIPLEVSTNARLLFFGLFAGGAVDLQVGRGHSTASLSGPVTGTVGDDAPEDIGSIAVTIDDQGQATPVDGRLFGGVQIHLLPVKIYTQVNVATSASVGFHAGLRVAL